VILNLNNLDPNDPQKIIPLDQDSADVQEVLKDLQGNILKGHGRHYTAHIFIKFGMDPSQARKWVKDFSKYITTAFDQRKVALARRKALDSGKTWEETTFRGFVLSAKGYQALDFKKSQIPSDPKFRNGMEASGPDLNDPNRKDWEDPYKEDIHGMILIANQKLKQVKAETRKILGIIKKTKGAASEITTQYGRVIKNPDTKDTVEHFGYIDGRSQPLFLKEEIELQIRREGIDQYDPSTPLNMILVREPPGSHEKEHYGSYFVFRKLEQNVKGFKECEKKLAKALKLGEKEEERAGALAVGRFEDGTLVTLQYGEGMHNPIFNNFNYDNDTGGSKCPFHAHIRKVNPRDQSVEERKRRIARRGITYGKRRKDLTDRPMGEVGLLFMCFQANIANQFERLQKLANSIQGGLDPIIGQSNVKRKQHWPWEWAGKDRKTQNFDFHGFVTLKGGEYFFAPSISFLENLKN
jgi:Dyp-type peroxidase family